MGNHLRILLGIILGAFLAVGGAYLYDSHTALSPTAQATARRPLVNWDVVNVKWNHFTGRARAEWARLAG